MVAAQTLRVHVEAGEATRLRVRLDFLHLDDLGAGENSLELDRSALFFLVLDDFLQVFLDSIALLQLLVSLIALIGVLITG